MDMVIDESRQRLGQVIRNFLADRCPLEKVRELEGAGAPFPHEMWREMAALGWVGLDCPEHLGGSGGGLMDLLVLHTEIGRSLAPGPHLEVALCTHALLSADYADNEVIRALAGGDVIAVPAHLEADGALRPRGVALTATRSGYGDRYHLSGAKVLVPFAAEADYMVVTARSGPKPLDITLFLVDAHTRGVAIEALPNISTTPLSAVTFEDVQVSRASVVGVEHGGWNVFEPALRRAGVLRCAQITGAGERLLEMSVDYATQRRQFGAAIGHFQAVQYLCTDIAIATHLTGLLARRAAWLIDNRLPHDYEVAVAKAYASRAAPRIAHCAHEVHAGLAFMMECDVQLFSRRLKAWELDAGDSCYHDDELVDALRELTPSAA